MQYIVNSYYDSKVNITNNGFVNISSSDVSFDDPFIKLLLIKYNHQLMLSYDAKPLLNIIPKTIIKLALQFDGYDDISIDNLPYGLKEFYVLDSTNANFNKSLNHLSISLNLLSIMSKTFNQEVTNLQALTKLYIWSPVFDQVLYMLPLNLEEVSLSKHMHTNDPQIVADVYYSGKSNFKRLIQVYEEYLHSETYYKIYNNSLHSNNGFDNYNCCGDKIKDVLLMMFIILIVLSIVLSIIL